MAAEQRGVEKARALLYAENFKKGFEEGVQQVKLQVARELKLKGMNTDFIHDITKLPVEIIEAL